MVIWLLSLRAVFRNESCMFCAGLFSICRSLSYFLFRIWETVFFTCQCHCSFLDAFPAKAQISSHSGPDVKILIPHEECRTEDHSCRSHARSFAPVCLHSPGSSGGDCPGLRLSTLYFGR